ncbi:hypothetical protein [Paracoccus sanguinis]|uniref:hypothetical protein n=1 Tax=Paracoccus sanguinis TaxID=1545044 RepID=UPI0014512EDF|nr:hypothetical protein [Paracoccus sanguinis]QJD16223.1 hypothetical protein HGN31_04420 [Paracoccus sanguinis]
MRLRLIILAAPLALAACDDQAMKDFRMPWDKPEPVVAAPAAPAAPPKPSIPEPTGASPTQQPLEVAGDRTRVATADAETLDINSFTAGGEGWSATVSGKSVKFERPGAKAATVSVQRLAYAKGVEYVGTLNDTAFALNIRSEDCGGQPMTATLRANGRTFTGCASPTAAKAAASAKPATKPGA